MLKYPRNIFSLDSERSYVCGIRKDIFGRYYICVCEPSQKTKKLKTLFKLRWPSELGVLNLDTMSVSDFKPLYKMAISAYESHARQRDTDKYALQNWVVYNSPPYIIALLCILVLSLSFYLTTWINK